MFTITVTIDDLGREGVELVHDKLLDTFSELNHTGFSIEISEQDVEELVEEVEAEISENVMSVESAEESYISAFEGFSEEDEEKFS